MVDGAVYRWVGQWLISGGRSQLIDCAQFLDDLQRGTCKTHGVLFAYQEYPC